MGLLKLADMRLEKRPKSFTDLDSANEEGL